MVSGNVTEEQRDARVSGCAELLGQVEAEPELMERVITGDESWEFFFPQYDPRDQTPKNGMAFEGITKAKQRTHVHVKTEMHACVLL